MSVNLSTFQGSVLRAADLVLSMQGPALSKEAMMATCRL